MTEVSRNGHTAIKQQRTGHRDPARRVAPRRDQPPGPGLLQRRKNISSAAVGLLTSRELGRFTFGIVDPKF
jgi:hypothetical protein